MSQLLGPMAQNERGWELIREARLVLEEQQRRRRGSLAGGRISTGTVLGSGTQDGEEVAEGEEKVYFMPRLAIRTSPPVRCRQVERGGGRGEDATVLASRGEARKTKPKAGRQPVLVLVVVLRTAAVLARDLTRLTLCAAASVVQRGVSGVCRYLVVVDTAPADDLVQTQQLVIGPATIGQSPADAVLPGWSSSRAHSSLFPLHFHPPLRDGSAEPSASYQGYLMIARILKSPQLDGRPQPATPPTTGWRAS